MNDIVEDYEKGKSNKLIRLRKEIISSNNKIILKIWILIEIVDDQLKCIKSQIKKKKKSVKWRLIIKIRKRVLEILGWERA